MDDSGPESREVDDLFGLVAKRYGDRLTPAQLEDVRKAVEAVVTGARVLRAVKLTNADEPMQPFVPFRADA